jgi:hypothetical protein
MGASNAIRAYATYGAILGDHALRALVYMALVAADKDAEPWFGLGHEALSHLAFGREVPDQDKDPAEHEAALRSVRRAMSDLQAAGAIRTSERARFGAQRAQNARYRLYLDGPCPPGEVPPPRRWKRMPSDAKRPMGPDAGRPVNEQSPPDAERPMASDADRPAETETIGRFVTDHRTQNVQPPDAKRPTKEEEEEEERINDGPVVDATVEGAPASLQIVQNKPGRHRMRAAAPGERPLIPHGLPIPEPEAAEPAPPCGHPACEPLTRLRDLGDGTYERCPDCHPSARKEAS